MIMSMNMIIPAGKDSEGYPGIVIFFVRNPVKRLPMRDFVTMMAGITVPYAIKYPVYR